MALSALKIPAASPLVNSSGALERKKRLYVAPLGAWICFQAVFLIFLFPAYFSY
jgi:hypothetical protein